MADAATPEVMMLQSSQPEPEEPLLLELRIHGVSNTPVTNVVGFAADDLCQCDGDTLGSFWTPAPEAIDRTRAAAHRRWPDGADGPGERDWVPPDYVEPWIRREGYSWGAQSRVSGPLPGDLGAAAVRVARAAWLLLIPLSVVNAAYWSRRLEPDPRQSATADAPPGQGRRFGRGLRPVLLMGLGLTLLFLSAFETAALDVVGTQCFRDRGAFGACPMLPDWLRSLAALSWTRRMVVLSVVPLLGLLVLRWVSASASVRYRGLRTPGALEPAPATATHIPVLAQADLWRRWWLARRAACIHVGAGVAVVSATLAWAGLWRTQPDCLRVSGLVAEECRAAMADRWPYGGLFLAAMVALAATLVLLLRTGGWQAGHAVPGAGGRQDGLARTAVTAEVAAWAVLALVGAALWRDDAVAPAQPLPGLSFIPGALVTVMFLIGCVAATWRRPIAWTRGATASAAVLATGLAAAALPVAGPLPPLVVGVGLVGLFLCAVPWQTGRSAAAWRDAAPGVFLLLALGLQMVLCSTLLVVLGDWLNGPRDAGSLFPGPAPAGAGGDGPPYDGSALRLPDPYALFLACTTLGLGIVVVLLLLVLVRRARHRGTDPDDVPSSALDDLKNIRQRSASLEELTDADTVVAVRRARRNADLLQRAESLVGGAAFLFGLALAATVLVLPRHGVIAENASSITAPLTTAGVWIVVGAWLVGIARVMTAKDAPVRPAGLLWDLACFLPRTAHPFAPPCYAERAVPEIVARVDAWLAGGDLPDGSPLVEHRRVVLAPHSMGVVLAVAALLQPHRAPGGWRGRVALLSYGTQVRPYFGRFFPELLGPRPVGNRPVACAAFTEWAWQAPDAPQDAAAPNAGVVAPTLVDVLQPREAVDGRPLWLSLWRRTDPLGMRAGIDAVDREAEEVNGASYLAEVATHGNYPQSIAYRRCLSELTRRLYDDEPAAAADDELPARRPDADVPAARADADVAAAAAGAEVPAARAGEGAVGAAT